MKLLYLLTLPLALSLVGGCVEVKVEGCDGAAKHERKDKDEGDHDKSQHKEKEDAEDDEGGHNKPEAELLKKARISEADARQIAMARVPNGKIKEGELEMERGHLQWSFDMATPDSRDITEVNVDAISGKVIDVSKEKPEKDEGKKEKKEKEEKDED